MSGGNEQITPDIPLGQLGEHSAIQNPHRRPPTGTDPAHVAELERENIRLQLLVAELLIKNQQLRKSD